MYAYMYIHSHIYIYIYIYIPSVLFGPGFGANRPRAARFLSAFGTVCATSSGGEASYISCFRRLARSARCNTMSRLTADAVCFVHVSCETPDEKPCHTSPPQCVVQEQNTHTHTPSEKSLTNKLAPENTHHDALLQVVAIILPLHSRVTLVLNHRALEP